MKAALVPMPPATATTLAMPAPMVTPGPNRTTGDAATAAHIVPAAVVAPANEGGNFAKEGLGFRRTRGADRRGPGRSCPQRCGREHGGADKT